MTTRTIPAFSATWGSLAGHAAQHVWRLAFAMVAARGTRRLLAEMDDRLLADIGVSRSEAQVEASRPLWDLTPRPR